MRKRRIHERVRSRIEAAGLSASDVAAKSHWSEQRVQRLLRGTTRLLAEDMEVLARILRTPVGNLYDEGLSA